tara:strand:- start:3239 stop:4945 length:1707 start_codon:yes stop_codon:yes gene_type:complete
MNKKELQYVKDNYFKKQTFDVSMLLEAIDEVIGIELPKIKKRKLREQMEGTALALQAIPEISVTELGWTDVRTKGDQEVDGPARQQLLQFTQNIQGEDLQAKIASLADFYTNPESVNKLGGSTPGQKISNALSYLVFYKTLTQVISNFNAASAGFNFEAFLAVLLEGQQIPANTGTIADFVAGDNTPISLKLYAEKSLVVGGSFTDLVGDLVNPQYSPHDYMQYVVVLKSFEGGSSGLDVSGQLKFYRFNFTLDNVANIVLNSMAKSIRCIQMPVKFIEEIKAGNTDYDFNATLPSQENLPSVEELETIFIKNLTDKIQSLDYGVTQEELNQYTQILDWANNDQLFRPVPKGERELVVRGQSNMPTRGLGSEAVTQAVINAFKENGYSKGQMEKIRFATSAANRDVRALFTAARQADERTRVLSAEGVFADPQTSVEFYNSLQTPELKKQALLNSRGYLQTFQFDLNRKQVLQIDEHAGEAGALPSGQSSPNIGTIMIGAQYVQQMLDNLTEELNNNIFAIFQAVKAIQEGTYAFMAGGLQDDDQAKKAINASQEVEAKTQELRPEKK